MHDKKSSKEKVIRCFGDIMTIIYTDTGEKTKIPYQENYVSDIQLNGKTLNGKRFQKIEQPQLNQYQVKIYKTAIYGIKAFSEEELKAMNVWERRKVENTHKKTKKLLNRWKQQLISTGLKDLFESIFPKSKNIKKFFEDCDYTCDEEINFIPFKEIGINQTMLIEKLIEWEILPLNFYSLK